MQSWAAQWAQSQMEPGFAHLLETSLVIFLEKPSLFSRGLPSLGSPCVLPAGLTQTSFVP